MGARVLHVQDDADLASSRVVGSRSNILTGQAIPGRLFKLLSAPERARRQAAFEIVCARRGAMARIARAWDVSDQVVYNVRDGVSPLSDDRILALPRAQREHLHEVLSATAQLSFGF